jgi:predicted nuclease of predicted toxin-antitoxin system
MLFLVDEDLDTLVGPALAAVHTIAFVVAVLGSGAKDAEIIRYAQSQACVIVTADNELARKLRQKRTAPCIWLRDCVPIEATRVTELLDVITREVGLTTYTTWIEIRKRSYSVYR